MYRNVDDLEMYCLLQQGNEMAFTYLYNKYSHEVYLSAYVILRNEQEAKDMVQDVFTLLWTKKSKIKIESSIKGYLTLTARNLSLNKLNSLSHYKSRNAYYFQQNDVVEYPSLLEKSDDIEMISDLLRDVPKKQRRSIEKVYGEGKTHKEAAQDLGVSVNTIIKQVYAALKLMRTKIPVK
jgi:RNA polymerase sigma-70 factor (ECF subfamily)